MCPKKVLYNIEDKVFAKLRGHRAWPALVIGIKTANTLSKQKYVVHFYGTGDYAECKGEMLFPYNEYKAKLGKPIKEKTTKLKRFVEALSQIESDADPSIFLEGYNVEALAPSNANTIIPESSTTNEFEKSCKIKKKNVPTKNETVKLTIDKSNVSKQTKRKISDFKPVVGTSKKLIPNEIKILENLKQHSKKPTSKINVGENSKKKKPPVKLMTYNRKVQENLKVPSKRLIANTIIPESSTTNEFDKSCKIKKNNVSTKNKTVMKPLRKSITNKIKVLENLKQHMKKPTTSKINAEENSKDHSVKSMASKAYDKENFKVPSRKSLTNKTKVLENSIQHSKKLKNEENLKEPSMKSKINKIKVHENLKEPSMKSIQNKIKVKKNLKEPTKKPMVSKINVKQNLKEPSKKSMTNWIKIQKNSKVPPTKFVSSKIKVQENSKQHLKKPMTNKIKVFDDPKLNATPFVLIERLPRPVLKKAYKRLQISSVSSKKVFELKDKVFAKVRGYPVAWPAKISGIKTDMFSRPKYRVDFYGTGKHALCKPEDLYPYEQNISKVGKNSNKNKRFAEALFQMECDVETSVEKKLSLPKKHSDNFKRTKRNMSVTKPEKHSKKLMRNKIKAKKLLKINTRIPEKLKKHSKKAMTNIIDISKDPKPKMQPVVGLKKLSNYLLEKCTSRQKPETSDQNMCTKEKNSKIEKPSKTIKSISKIKYSPTSKYKKSSYWKSVASQYSKKPRPKEFTDCQYDSKKTEHARLSKENSKQSPKTQNAGLLLRTIEDLTDKSETSSEVTSKTKDSNTSSILQKTSRNHAVVPDINEAIPVELNEKSMPSYKNLREKEKNSKIIEKPLTSKTLTSISQIKDGPTSNNEISAHKTIPIIYTYRQYDSKKTEHSRSSEGNSKQNVGTNECVTLSEQNSKSKGSTTSSIFEKTTRNHARVLNINEAIELKKISVSSYESLCVQEKNSKVIKTTLGITSKTVKSISTNDIRSSSDEKSSCLKNETRVLQSTYKTVPKEYTDYQYDTNKTEHSRLSKGNSKQNVKIIIERVNSPEQYLITKGPNTSSKLQKTSRNNSVVQDINEVIFKELGEMSKVIETMSEVPVYLKCRVTGLVTYLKTNWKKNGAYQVYHVTLLLIEALLQHHFFKLCVALNPMTDDNINYVMALQSLEGMNKLKLNSIMLKKNHEIVSTIGYLTAYGLNEPNTVTLTLMADKIRYKAEEFYSKLKSLFYVPDGRTFEDVFDEAVSNFITITQHLTKHDRTKISIVKQEFIPDSSIN